MCRKLLQWTEEQKKEWIASPSCSSLLADSFLFACKQVLGSMFIFDIGDQIVDMNLRLREVTYGTRICFVRSGICETKRSG